MRGICLYMAKTPSPDLKIEPLASDHDRARFACGIESLDRYLRTQAGQDVRRHGPIAYSCSPIGAGRTASWAITRSCATALAPGDVPYRGAQACAALSAGQRDAHRPAGSRGGGRKAKDWAHCCSPTACRPAYASARLGRLVDAGRGRHQPSRPLRFTRRTALFACPIYFGSSYPRRRSAS